MRPSTLRSGSVRAVVIAATLSSLGGCGPTDAPASGTEALRDTLADGRVVVRWPSLPSGDTSAAAATLRIGSVEGDGPSAFGDVRGIAEGPDGAVFVLDYQAAELRKFGPDGAFRGTIARRGQGPGELMEPNGMITGPDGTLWVKDHGNWWIIGFSPDSGEVARHPTVTRSYGYVWDGAVDDFGRFWKSTSHSDDDRRVRPEPGLHEGTSRRYYKRYDPRTETFDSIYLGVGSYKTLIVDMGGGGRRYMGMPFAPGELSAVDPDGHVWGASSGEYRIARLDETGDTVMVLEVDSEGPPVTGEDREGWLARYRERDAPEVVARIEAGVAEHFPPRKPVLEGLSVDRRGRLWVRRTAAAGEPVRFDVFDRTGEHLGTLRTHEPLFTYVRPVVGRTHLYGLVRDELDVPFVVRIPLPEALGG